MTNAQFMDDKGNLTGEGKLRIIEGLALLQHAIRLNNFEKGWRAETPVGETKRVVSEHTSLLHSEVTEIFEAFRNNEPEIWYQYPMPKGEKTNPDHPWAEQSAVSVNGDDKLTLGKPQGMVSELADVLIRLLDFADEYQFELADVVLEKHDYNLTRPYRHGGKAA